MTITMPVWFLISCCALSGACVLGLAIAALTEWWAHRG
jgi:hypothetical protein